MTENTSEYRIEHDTMGEVRVPADALYSAQTQRAVQNFPISGKTLERQHIRALAQVKKAAAKANQELGVLDAQRAEAIRSAADRVAAGEFDVATLFYPEFRSVISQIPTAQRLIAAVMATATNTMAAIRASTFPSMMGLPGVS